MKKEILNERFAIDNLEKSEVKARIDFTIQERKPQGNKISITPNLWERARVCLHVTTMTDFDTNRRFFLYGKYKVYSNPVGNVNLYADPCPVIPKIKARNRAAKKNLK